MATTKKTNATEATPPASPVLPKQLVTECAETGAKIVSVAQSFYRNVEGATQRCGITQGGEPDGSWATVADADVPPKAKSMLGMT